MSVRKKKTKIVSKKEDSKKKKSDQETDESKEKLTQLFEKYKEVFKYSSLRLDRLSKLLSRSSAKKWSNEKRKKMIRRHLIATEDSSFAFSTIDQIEFRLSQLYET